MDVYAALGIRKERIEPRQAWQNYVESHFNIARKMADAKFARATSWEEVLAIHRRFQHDYQVQRHWAHEKREDGCLCSLGMRLRDKIGVYSCLTGG
jgi:hypothetical protein